MICRGFLLSLGLALITSALSGCGEAPEGGNVTLAEGGGIVTFKGAPLADASVTFMPEYGPVAIGTTDLAGKFKLSTGTRSGVAVGDCKVTVTLTGGAPASGSAAAVPKTQEEGLEMQKKMREMAVKGAGAGGAAGGGPTAPKSLIPERYGKPESSGLRFKVEKDASKNQFTIDLTE